MAKDEPRNEALSVGLGVTTDPGGRGAISGDGPVQSLAEIYREMPKKARDGCTRDHDLHVMLIMRDEEVSKTKAIAQAYWEGPVGLVERLRK